MEVPINIDIDKVIMEEYEEKDLRLGGVPGLLSERRTAITRAMSRELDENFFLVAAGKRKESDGTIETVQGGTEVTVSGDTIKDRVAAAVMKLPSMFRFPRRHMRKCGTTSTPKVMPT